VVFLTKVDSVTIKLISPASDDSPIKGFALKGGGLHHLCFIRNKLELHLPMLQEKEARLIVPSQPDEAFSNHNIEFLLTSNNLKVVLIDTTEKIRWND